MSQINVTPHNGDSNIGLLAMIILIVALVALAIFGYNNGWFMMNPKAATPSKSSINITIPASTPTSETKTAPTSDGTGNAGRDGP